MTVIVRLFTLLLCSFVRSFGSLSVRSFVRFVLRSFVRSLKTEDQTTFLHPLFCRSSVPPFLRSSVPPFLRSSAVLCCRCHQINVTWWCRRHCCLWFCVVADICMECCCRIRRNAWSGRCCPSTCGTICSSASTVGVGPCVPSLFVVAAWCECRGLVTLPLATPRRIRRMLTLSCVCSVIRSIATMATL